MSSSFGTLGAFGLHMSAPPQCTIYYGLRTVPDESNSARWRPADELFAQGARDEPAVLVVDAPMLDRMSDLRKLPRRVVLVSADDAAQTALGTRALISIVGVNDLCARNRLLDAACVLSCARLAGVRLRRRLARRKHEARETARIGMALMMERDREALLRAIVDQGKRLTGSDAGAMLLAETDTRDVTCLRATFWRFDHLPELRAGDRTYAVDDKTIIGHAARIGEPVVVADAYNLPDDVAFESAPEFDHKHGYYRKSMLVVPMLDHLDHLVGVLLFVNRKTDPSARITNREDADQYVLPYTEREVSLARSLAGQAAVSIENANLYARIEQILESFVKASVSAIDLRDPSTAGHSLRVSSLTTAIAAAVERCGRGKYRDIRFTPTQMRELRFAALLHDFGKITVHEDVLVKAKKLPPVLWERVSARFELIRRTMEIEYYKQRASLRCSNDDNTAAARLEEKLTAQLAQLEHMWTVVRNANQPAVLPTAPAVELCDIATRTFRRGDGSVAPYLTENELHFLQLPRGTLDDAERAEVESHADETYRFLVNIPWTQDLGSLVTFASSHHEKLDGSGYPRRLKGDEIPVQVRMLTIADIFDALTESDRPYKKAVPTDKALDILRAEATAGRLDPDLVEIMIESQVYRRILDEDWRHL
jgi:HD-GYP domain-containing protein (c-di-GMP phosphodiesterase class II)